MVKKLILLSKSKSTAGKSISYNLIPIISDGELIAHSDRFSMSHGSDEKMKPCQDNRNFNLSCRDLKLENTKYEKVAMACVKRHIGTDFGSEQFHSPESQFPIQSSVTFPVWPLLKVYPVVRMARVNWPIDRLPMKR